MSEEFRGLFKEFAWKVYKEALMTFNEVQKIANKAYDDGFKDGKTEAVETIQGRLEEVADDLDDLKG
jgi:phosphoserine phosphatase